MQTLFSSNKSLLLPGMNISSNMIDLKHQIAKKGLSFESPDSFNNEIDKKVN